MAVMGRSSNNWIFSLKVLLISTGVLTIGIILKLSVPVVLEFMISVIPLFWRSLLSWLTPPYLYVIINGIIITIAASSRFHHKNQDHYQPKPLVPVKVTSDDQGLEFTISSEYDALMMKNSLEEIRSKFEGIVDFDHHEARSEFEGMISYENHEVLMKNSVDNQMEFNDLKPKLFEQKGDSVSELKINREIDFDQDEKENSFVISKSSKTPNRTDSMEIPTEYLFSNEKPPASSRFNHKKSVKASPEGGRTTLGVTKPKRHETLESTWKMITDGRSMPLTRHLKKSDTWESRHHNIQQQDLTSKLMKKSETFHERNNNNKSSLSQSPGLAKLRKEPSLSQDDLNRRVEAFINKFNEEMRLQRQESLNQYKEMVNLS